MKKIEYKDKKKKSNLWLWGIFLYSQAIPFVIVSNIIYWVPFKKWFHITGLASNYSNIFKLYGQSIREDINEILEIQYEKQYYINTSVGEEGYEHNKHGWR